MIFKRGTFNRKQTISLVAIAIGVIFMIFASHGMQKANEAKSSVDKFTGFFTNATGIWNPVIKFFGGEAHEEASKYDITLRTLMLVGILMTVSGIWGFYYNRTRR